jgi:hypothetical protein
VALVGVSAYPAIAADRLVAPIVATVGVAVAVFLVSIAFRWSAGIAAAIALAGAAYGVYLGFRGGAVDGWAPLVAAGLFLAAELGFRAIEPQTADVGREVVSRSAVWLLAGTVATAVTGALLLVVAGSATAGLWLEALGVAAAVAALALVVAVVSSSR